MNSNNKSEKKGLHLFIPYHILWLTGLFVLGAVAGRMASRMIKPAKTGVVFEKNQTHIHEETEFCHFENRCFRGKINGKYPIEMYLSATGGIFSGYYQYVSVGKRLKIAGEMGKDDSWILYEFDDKGNQTGLFEIHTQDTNILEGKWSKPDYSQCMSFLAVAEQPLLKIEKALRDTAYPDMSHLDGEFVRAVSDANESHQATLSLLYKGLNRIFYTLTISNDDEITDYSEGIMVSGADGKFKSNNADPPLSFEVKGNMVRIAAVNGQYDHIFSGSYFRTKDQNRLKFYSMKQPYDAALFCFH